MKELEALIAACEDMEKEGLDISVLEHWQTGFPKENNNN